MARQLSTGADPGRGRPVVVGLLVEPRYRSQRQPAGLVRRLQSGGHQVRQVDLAAAVRLGDHDWCRQLDVLVCRGRSPAVLALLEAAAAAGVRCVNTADAVASVVNKAAMGVRLAAAGIPTPETYLGLATTVAAAAADQFPLILKPACGDNAQGLRIVWSADELLALDWPEPITLAQRYLPGAGPDLKLYVAGRTVWAIRKPSPIDPVHGGRVSAAADARPVRTEVTEDLEKLALRCGDVFGLDLYGVDCLITDSGPLVLEVNDFPNYSGLLDADVVLADLVLGVEAA
jgi:ribosomal protein S6--L-glutamate ligase